MNEQSFYEELSRMPETPKDMYLSVHKKIARRKRIRQGAMALAASALLVIGAGIALRNDSAQPGLNATDRQAYEELKAMHNYIHGQNIETEISNYALVDPVYY